MSCYICIIFASDCSPQCGASRQAPIIWRSGPREPQQALQVSTCNSFAIQLQSSVTRQGLHLRNIYHVLIVSIYRCLKPRHPSHRSQEQGNSELAYCAPSSKHQLTSGNMDAPTVRSSCRCAMKSSLCSTT